MKTSDQINEIAAALAKAQGEVENASRDAVNPAFKGEGKPKGTAYATLASVMDACRSALSKHGIAVIQSPGTDDTGAVTMTTTLAHASGQWMQSEMACRPMKQDAQGLGSVISYLRRYCLASMVGVCPDDDDGNAASGHGSPQMPPAQATRPAAKTAEPPKAAPPLWERDSYALPAGPKFVATFCGAAAKAPTLAALTKLGDDNDATLKSLSDDDYGPCRDALGRRYDELNKSTPFDSQAA